ncbi:MAG: hypothetical protein H0S85_14975 [Desulfovibrionaceae bacterium]|jgi:hypothetical protein|nr:hypothetical protein [Desulfovibrionaceae bacterium]
MTPPRPADFPGPAELARAAEQKARALCAFAESMLKTAPGTPLKAALAAFTTLGGEAAAPQGSQIPQDMAWDELFLSIVWAAVAEEYRIGKDEATQEIFDPVYDAVLSVLSGWITAHAADQTGTSEGPAQ